MCEKLAYSPLFHVSSTGMSLSTHMFGHIGQRIDADSGGKILDLLYGWIRLACYVGASLKWIADALQAHSVVTLK